MSLRFQVVFVLLILSFKGFGQQPPLNIITDATSIPVPGDTLDVEVRFADFNQLFGFTKSIRWDSNVLQIDTIPFVDANVLAGFSRGSMSLPNQNAADPSEGQILLSWFSGNAQSIPDSTHLFTMRFSVLGAPCDTTSFSLAPLGDVLDANFEDIGAIINGDLIEIPGTGCDVIAPVGFDLLNVTTMAGSNVCMPMVVSNFDSINSFSGSITYDPSILNYTGAQNFGVAGFSNTDVIDLSAGILTYTWVDQTTTSPETLVNGATLFDICFDAVGGAGTTSVVQITDTPSAISVSKAPSSPQGQSTALDFTVDQGIVNIQAMPMPDPLGLSLSSISADMGDNVCLPLTVTNFTNINSVSASTSWDASILQYTGVQGFNLPNFTANNVNDNNAATGSLGFTWSDITMNSPATLANGNSIFQICFDVIGDPGTSSDIDFGNSPMMIAATQAGTPPMDLMVNTSDGSVSVNTVALPGVNFTVGSESGDCGDNVCIPITVDGFTNINSVNGSLMWDANDLSYTGLGTVNLPGLSNTSGLNTNDVANGMLGFSWLDLSGSSAVTLAGGGTMLEVCFDVVGSSSGSTSTVKMTGIPTIISVSEQPANPADPSIMLDFTLVDGSFVLGTGCSTGSADVTFTVGSESGDCGDNVCIPITVAGFTNINSVNGSLMWDASDLTYTGLGTVNLPGLSNTSGLNANDVANGMLGFSWLDLSGSSAVTLPAGGTMLEVCFDVVGDSSGSSSVVKMTGTPTIISVSEQPANPADPSIPLEFALFDGSFAIGTGCTPTGPSDVTFTVGPQKTAGLVGDCGENVCIPITVSGFNNINSVNGSLMWNPSHLSYTGLGIVNLPGLSNTSGLNTNGVANGMLGFSWLDLSGAAPVTILTGETMLEVCFDVVGENSGSTSTINMTGSPTIISISEQPADPADPSIPLTFTIVDEEFNVGLGCIPSEDAVTFIFPDLCIDASESNICVPLTVQNFTNIAQLDFSLMWDPSVLSYDGFQNVTLTGFNPMGQLNLTMIDDGQLSFIWFDDSGSNPETAADGEAILEICFDVVGNDGDSSSLAIFNGLAVGLTDIAVGQADPDPTIPVMTVDYSLDNGSVKIGGCVEGDFKLTIGNTTTTNTSQQACVDFSVEGFNDIIITEWNIQWDPTDLCFASVSNLNPAVPSLTASRFDSSTPGVLKLAWSDPSLDGKTIPNGETYYTVCFDTKMNCGESTSLSVLVDSGQAAFFEVVNEFNPTTPLGYDTCDGSVGVICGMDTLMFDGPATVTHPSCANGPQNTGSISVNFIPGQAPHNCNWTGPNGFAQSGICTGGNTSTSGLAPGTYNLTITDDNGVAISDTWTINNGPTISLNGSVTSVTCDAQGNIILGSIVVNPSGGTAPYSQVPTAANLIGLNVGSYPVVVTDANGCSAEQRYEIIEEDCVTTPKTLTATATPSSSCQCDGTITASASGGIGPYQFFYSPNISNLSRVCPGTYTVTCRDSRGEEAQTTVVVGLIDMGDPQILISNIRSGNSCTLVGGGADIDITGGCPPYICRMGLIVNGVNGGAMSCDNNDNILPGTYYVEVVDNNGNILAQTQFVIPDMGGGDLMSTAEVVTQPGPCSYNLNGTVNVEARGGCMPYSVSIIPSDGNPQNPTIIDTMAIGLFELPSGMYDIIVNDNGSSAAGMHNIIINSPPAAPQPGTLTMTDSCVATLPFSGGTGPYTYEWYDSDNNLVSTSESIDLIDTVRNVCDTVTVISTFTIVLRDANDCVDNFSQTIMCNGLVDCGGGGDCPLSWTDVVGSMTACAGDQACSGTISGSIDQCDGFGPYTITIKDDTGESFTIIQETAGAFMFINLCAGSYGMIATDADGVDWVLGTNIPVTAPEAMLVELSRNDCVDEDGELEVAVTGGIEGYSYSWTFEGNPIGTDSPILENLADGSYFLDVTDVNDCLDSKVYIIGCDGPPPPEGCEGTPIITPGDDDLNNNLFIDCVEFGTYELKVYDRWGRLVHGSLDYQNDWNGIDQDGTELGEGAYYWVLLSTDGENTMVDKGTVTLLRNR